MSECALLSAPMPMEAAAVVRKSRRKTNSERGKEFRAKRKDYESSLVELITSLRDEVRDLRFLREIRGETALVARSSLDGSLAKVVREYFSLFARGRPVRLHVGGKRAPQAAMAAVLAKQDAFVRESMDESMAFAGVQGGAVLLDQWERYTLYHSRFRVAVVALEISGGDDAPLVTVTSHLTVTLSRDTFTHIFPHVVHDEALVNRLVGTEVTYRGVNRFQFGADHAHILVYESDVDFVNAFLAAGVSLNDVALLMNRALIADQHLLGHEPSQTEAAAAPRIVEVVEPEPSTQQEDEDDTPEPKRACQTISFLLN